jgi:hypothetical protein
MSSAQSVAEKEEAYKYYKAFHELQPRSSDSY